MNPLLGLMNKLAKDSFEKGNDWGCPHSGCGCRIKSKDYKTAKDFAKACLDHAKLH